MYCIFALGLLRVFGICAFSLVLCVMCWVSSLFCVCMLFTGCLLVGYCVVVLVVLVVLFAWFTCMFEVCV